MPVNLPLQNYFNPAGVPDSWVRPSDWITITDTPNEVQFLMSDINDANCTIKTQFTRISGNQNVLIDWGDGTTSTVSTTTSTNITHQYTPGSGTPCSLGYTTFKIRVYLSGSGSSTIDNVNIYALLNSGNTANGVQLCGVLEAYYGDNTQTTIPINFDGASLNDTSRLATYNYLSYVKCPAVVTWTSSTYLFRNCYNISKIVMPTTANSITTLMQAFLNCYSLVDLTFITNGNSITSLNNTFSGCFSLKKITLPNTLDSCTDLTSTFSNCFKLSNVTLPSINNCNTFTSTFSGCANLAWVKFTSMPTITGSTITIPNTFLSSCPNLQTVYFPTTVNSSSIFSILCFGNTSSTIRTIKLPTNLNSTSISFFGCTNLVSCVLPTSMPSLTSLGATFSNCTSLVNVVLPSTVGATINLNQTFINCSKLQKITIPSSYVISNLANTFDGCLSLKTLDWNPGIQNSLTTMASTFNNCRILTSITLPTSMNILNTLSQTFTNCSSLENVVFPSTLNSVTTLNFTFNGCTNLKSVTLPTSMIALTNFAATFGSCFSLRSVTLPNSTSNAVTTFNGTFSNCFSLSSVTFPGFQPLGGVTTIASMFLNCANLTTITNFDKIGTSSNAGLITGATLTNNRFTSISFIGKYSDLNLSGNSALAKANVQSVRLLNTNTGQWTGTSPQINVSYTNMSTANLIQLFNDMAAQGTVTSKTINITGATGTAGLSAANRQIITNVGWTITG